MTDKLRAAAQAALEELIASESNAWNIINDLEAALAEPAIKESLTVAEPVAWEHHEYRPYGAPGEIRIHAILASQYTMADGSVAKDFQWLVDQYKADKNTIKLLPLYTAPSRREWVGLTAEDINQFETWFDDEEERKGWVDPALIAKYFEAKLREKNCG